MIFPVFGVLLLVGLFFLVDGWSNKNYLFLWIGALCLMLLGLANFLSPLEITTGSITNKTGTYIVYSPVDSWVVIPFSRILFWVGLFGLSFPITLTVDENKKIREKNRKSLSS